MIQSVQCVYGGHFDTVSNDSDFYAKSASCRDSSGAVGMFDRRLLGSLECFIPQINRCGVVKVFISVLF